MCICFCDVNDDYWYQRDITSTVIKIFMTVLPVITSIFNADITNDFDKMMKVWTQLRGLRNKV